MYRAGERLAQWSEALGAAPSVLTVLATAMGALAAGSILRVIFHGIRRTDESAERLRSLGTWWAIALVCAAAALIGRFGVILLMAAVSALALREYLGLVRPAVGRAAVALAYAAIPVQYGCIALGQADLAAAIAPTLGSIVMLGALIVPGLPAGYTAAAGRLLVGMIVTVYLLSFTALSPFPGAEPTRQAGTVGWFVLLVLVAMVGDIVQALVGRPLGRRRVLPTVSPGKTWEGWIAGALAAAGLAAWAGPLLTPMPLPVAVGAGLVVSLGGFFGDLNVSAIKRDCGVEDSGTLLAGQGGILDRADTLSFAAPLLFLYVRIWLAVSA